MTCAFSDLRLAAYCPRKLYYRRRESDWAPPEIVTRRRALSFRYPELLDADDRTLSELPIEIPPEQFQYRLSRARDRLDDWDAIVDPEARNVPVSGRECHGIVHKLLSDPARPSIVSPGRPPDCGVWEPHAVQAVAAAKALAWERRQVVDEAFVEYPAHGVVRRVELTTRRKAAYRDALRTVRELDGPPSRLGEASKCDPCEYRDRCGVRTRTLGSLLGG